MRYRIALFLGGCSVMCAVGAWQLGALVCDLPELVAMVELGEVLLASAGGAFALLACCVLAWR